MRFAAPSVFVGAVLFASATAAQESFVLKAACIGGYANTVTEVAAAADGTISRRNLLQLRRRRQGVAGPGPRRSAG